MPRAETEIVLKRPLDDVWRFFTDLERVGTCLSFVEKLEPLSAEASSWKLRAPASVVTRTPSLHASITDRQERERLVWLAKGENIQWSGEVTLRSADGEQTWAKIALEVKGLGVMAPLINTTSSAQIPGQLRYFVDKIKEKLEGGGR